MSGSVSPTGAAGQPRRPENQGGVNLPNLVAGLIRLEQTAPKEDKTKLAAAREIIAGYIKQQKENAEAAQRLAGPQ